MAPFAMLRIGSMSLGSTRNVDSGSFEKVPGPSSDACDAHLHRQLHRKPYETLIWSLSSL